MDSSSKGEMPFTPPLTLPELAEIVLRDPPDTRIIDLRTADEFDRAHIPCSSRLGADEIDLPYLRPPRRRRLALLAEDPALAASCALRLREHGYDARPLGVPISSWIGDWEGGPESKPAWEPSRLVAEWAERLVGLRDAVDLGCGSGRDAVYLALRGFRVTAIDILPDALAQGRLLAARHGVEVSFICADLAREPECWKGPWGVVNVQRFLDRDSLPLIRERLRESGYVLYDTFLDAQAEEGRKPRNRAFLLKSGELREKAGRGLRVLEYREGRDDDGDWTASLVARRESPGAASGDRSSPKRGG